MIIDAGNVPQIHEYAEGKIILVTAKSMRLYENWKMTKVIKQIDQVNDNYFTMISRASLRPMGFFCLIPGFEDVPLVVVSGNKGITIVNLRDEYSEPLILVNSTASFGQQQFFFKTEDYGLSFHFTLKRIINAKGKERHNWARMPLKPDFMQTLKDHFRLPFASID